ncbi:MAG: glycoside hydrolase family 13 protein [Bacillota bacterium]
MTKKWHKESIVYQIYPRSFMDSNGDGIGDIRGIIDRLDYLKDLGVDIIWLSPIYKSPNDDNGYDISDYRDIMEEFGTMQDFELLLSELHRRSMKLIMDLVVNHTSDEHQWFKQAKSSKDNPYRDYYIWRKGRNGRPPNNWVSVFSGSVWEMDEGSEEYYLHLFSKKQPDLNWENPKLRKEIYEMMKWWLNKGVDGFRMDVINLISKAPELPDAGDTGSELQWGGEYFVNGPRIHEYLREMHREVMSAYDVLTVGETVNVTPELAVSFSGDDSEQLDMVFQFNHMVLGLRNGTKWYPEQWKLKDLKTIITEWQTKLHGKAWNTIFFNNHDYPRMVSKFGNDGCYRVESAKMLAVLMFTLEGTPYMYQGEEIGMTNVAFEDLSDYRDVETFNAYNSLVKEQGMLHEDFMKALYKVGRDNSRTPLHWDDTDNAGFTKGEPWIKVNPNYKEINIKKEQSNPDSVLNCYKELIRLRKQHKALVYGKYIPLLEDDERIFAYKRVHSDESFLILLNFSEFPTEAELPSDIMRDKLELIHTNYRNKASLESKVFEFSPYEARIYKMS